MEKQIVKMAALMCEDCAATQGPCEGNNMCDAVLQQAQVLYNADYRKQSEVVNKLLCEIKEEITAALDSNYRVRGELELSDELYYAVNGKISALRGIEGFITELENKYNKN